MTFFELHLQINFAAIFGSVFIDVVDNIHSRSAPDVSPVGLPHGSPRVGGELFRVVGGS